MPAELTILPVKELFLQIRLALTNPPASLDTVKAAEIRELWQRLRQRQGKHHLKINTCAIVTIFRLFHLIRILQCRRRMLNQAWSTRR